MKGKTHVHYKVNYKAIAIYVASYGKAVIALMLAHVIVEFKLQPSQCKVIADVYLSCTPVVN